MSALRTQRTPTLTGDIAPKGRSDRDDNGGDAGNLIGGLRKEVGESDFDDLELGVGQPEPSGSRQQ